MFRLFDLKLFGTVVNSGHPAIRTGDVTMKEGREKGNINFNKVDYKWITVRWEEKTSYHRNAGKAAAGAIIGGVLTGGIGLIAGAAIGGKRKKESTHYAIFILEENETQYEVVVEIKAGDDKFLNFWFQKK